MPITSVDRLEDNDIRGMFHAILRAMSRWHGDRLEINDDKCRAQFLNGAAQLFDPRRRAQTTCRLVMHVCALAVFSMRPQHCIW